MHSILIIDDDVEMSFLLSRFLSKNNFKVETADTGARGLEKLMHQNFDLVLCDFRLGDTDGREVLEKIKKINSKTIVIIITSYSDIKIAVEMVKLGAFDYVAKPLILPEVLNLIGKVFDQKQAPEPSVSVARKQPEETTSPSFDEQEYMRTNSAESKALDKQIALIAPTNYSVILYGESGTGKEVIARTIHNLSPRRTKPFIAMDCGTLTVELANSEIFGHEKGAFTGAIGTKAGDFELADQGTLFLDEVTNLPYEVQATLLRVIQERKFKRLGGVKEMEIDVRIIVASNENLQEAYKKGKFREDLYHRFNEFSIFVPPLRLRKNDIMEFATFFLNKASNELDRKIEGFDEDVIETFMNYTWPGNIRELRNIVRRAVLLTQKGKVRLNTLPFDVESMNISNAFPQEFVAEPDLKAIAHEAEYETISRVLKQVNYNKTKAARILKIDRKTLYNKIKNFDL